MKARPSTAVRISDLIKTLADILAADGDVPVKIACHVGYDPLHSVQAEGGSAVIYGEDTAPRDDESC